MPIQIHGKQYVTVAERLHAAKSDLLSVNTEVLYQEPVVVKATITTKRGTFTGISAANPQKTLEKESPYEIAETSAVGRALAFAGYEAENIASADEVIRASKVESFEKEAHDPTDDWIVPNKEVKTTMCALHKVPMKEFTKGTNHWFSHNDPVQGWCSGAGYKLSKAK